jgi:cell division protein FtsI/penicillin-binding protein 2
MTRRTFLSSLALPFEGRPGVAVVLDAASGRVLPSHRLDRAAALVAPPGSTLKPFTLLALIESGRLPANAALACDTAHGCSHPALAAPFDPVSALAYSCNSWFAQMGGRLDPRDFRRRLEQAGLGDAGEIVEARSSGALQKQALGVDGIQVTPLALAHAYRRLALARAKDSTPALRPIFAGLEAAVRYGTAQRAQPPRLTVAGKTGTVAAGAWFAGYAPADRPEAVVVVFLEQGRGGADAAPVAAQVFEAWASAR